MATTTPDVLRAGRRETIRQSAYRLAESGRCRDWHAVEDLLCVRYGLLATRRLLTDVSFRADLNRRCAAATNKDI
ncbi:hypothetical protein P3T23_009585 [Paraburkholderia sp. GAS448]|uniref:hypothetical protein n=1 Tax=Paraburkholderia sp. GAS448 TaxID=3035136 RepID=UPI003D19AD25